MRTLVRELLRRVKPGSLVFIHDGLLISPEPSTVDLEACLIEASLGLYLVPPPHFLRTHHQDPSLGELRFRPWLPLNPAPKARKLAPAALHNFWSRRSGSTVRM